MKSRGCIARVLFLFSYYYIPNFDDHLHTACTHTLLYLFQSYHLYSYDVPLDLASHLVSSRFMSRSRVRC